MTVRSVYRMPIRRCRDAWRRPAMAGFALFLGLVAFAVTAGARADLAARTSALRTVLASTPPTAPVVVGSADYGQFTETAAPSEDGGMSLTSRSDTATVATATEQIRSGLAAELPLADRAQSWFTLATSAEDWAGAPSSAEPGHLAPRLALTYVDTLAAHARLLSGQWPSAAPPTVLPAPDPLVVDVAISSAAAELLALHVGSDATLTSERVHVVGIYEARDAHDAFWATNAVLATPMLVKPLISPPYWELSTVIGSGGADWIMAEGNRLPTIAWGFPLVTDRVDADHVQGLADTLDTLTGVQAMLLYTDQIPVSLTSQLPPTLHRFLAEQDVATLEQSMPVAGLALIAAAAAALLTSAIVEARRAEFRVLLARGAPLRHLGWETLADSAATVLPVTLGGVAIGDMVPGTSPTWLLGVIMVLTGTAALVPAAWTILLHRRSAEPRRRLPKWLVVSRRASAHSALAIACVAGLELVHQHGLTPGDGIDPYAAAAPVLTGALAALVTINVMPVLLRVARRRLTAVGGIATLLGVARVAQAPAATQATVFVLTTAVCTADLTLALSRVAGRAPHDPLQATAATTLVVLGVAAIVAACAVAGLAVRLEAGERRPSAFRLAAMGLTAGQARTIAVTEAAPPVMVSALTGAAVAVPLMWLVGPALRPAVIHVGASGLLLPALAVAVPAVAAGLVGTVGIGRGAAQALRIGGEL
jgi:hypothetical protein